MAVEYMLEITSSLEPSEILEHVFSAIGLSAEIRRSDYNPKVLIADAPDFRAFVFSRKNKSDISTSFSDELELTPPDISITFRSAGGDPFPSAFKAAMGLLEQIEGDAYFLYNGDELLVFRKSGQLVVNDICSVWTHTPYREVMVREIKWDYSLQTIPQS